MPEFDYRVVDPQGKIVTGTETASDESAVIADLRSRGLQIVDIRPARPPEPRGIAARRLRFTFEPFGLSRQAVAFFTRQLATTLNAGLPLLRALATLQAQTTSPRMRKLVSALSVSIQQGQSLNQAMSAHGDVFDDLYVSMVRVGEASGSLPVTVTRLAEVLERDALLRRKVRAALTYPLFVFVFSAVLVYCLVAFLLPSFRPVFEGAGLDIRRDYPLTQMLMEISRVAGNPWFIGTLVSGAVLVALLLQVVGRTRGGRLAIDSVKFYFPFMHNLISMAAITRFCRTFGVMLRSGVPLLESLIHVGNAAGNQVVTRSVQRVTRDLQSGEKISQTLARISLFPPLMVQMVTVGEETGTIDQMLERVADYYEQELESAVATMLALIEPLMMIVVGGIVCFFVMAVLLPIMGISTAYQNLNGSH
ncbi:MAG: type II secretion system F family protein [Proteobacteria bacterium]|nr:type II secretion system F family protein [Pseudomonadota bacterium]